jgi:hypothetical protein
MGVSLRTVQDGEQERRKPSCPAIALLRIAEQKPEVFLQLSWQGNLIDRYRQRCRTFESYLPGEEPQVIVAPSLDCIHWRVSDSLYNLIRLSDQLELCQVISRQFLANLIEMTHCRRGV